MRKLFLLLALLPFLCTCDRAQIDPVFEPQIIEWKLTAHTFSNGTSVETIELESERFVRFDNNRMFTNGPVCSLSADATGSISSVPYDSEASTIDISLDCPDSDPLPLQVFINEDLTRLTINLSNCVEGCALVYTPAPEG